MLCTFLANCGLLLQSGKESILIDAPNGLHTAFDGVSEEEHGKMVAGAVPYEGLCGLFFTHKHSDHYDKKRVREITETREDIPVYATNGATPAEGVVKAGPFTIRYFTIGHSGAEFWGVYHRVLLVEAEGKWLYISGDADWNKNLHLPILHHFPPDAAIWNPNYLSHEEGRALLETVPQNFIYHMPVVSEDVMGIGRRCLKEYARYGEALRAILVDTYPKTIEI